MARKGGKKEKFVCSPEFQKYEEEIISNPEYANMPDLYNVDGSIQWNTPSNRTGGMNKDSHDKREQWWREKAKEKGISTSENQWISRVAKLIHPTKLRPCAICGRVMDIRYCYLNSHTIKRISELDFVDETLLFDDLTNILDFVPIFIQKYGNRAYKSLPQILSCKEFPISTFSSIPNSVDAWLKWLKETYIPSEPSMLSPGAMSNAPDRLDGFHSYNRCCRPTSDKGRSKENLKSYSTDRRAFEFWSDGNWIEANDLMGYIASSPTMKNERCANGSDHPLPCTADHVGPISLGFCHIPVFRLLCKPCNSAKNNRMTYEDVILLKELEEKRVITSWYAEPIWKSCKEKVVDSATALQLSKIMRDNRNVAMMMLYELYKSKNYVFLLTLLNLDIANFKYSIKKVEIINHVVFAEFSKEESDVKYVNIQKIRKIGSSRFSVGLSSDIRDGDELNQREKVVLIPVSISNSLCDLDPVVEAFQLAS